MQIQDAKDVMWLGLAAFLLLVGGGLAYALWRTGRTLRGVEADLHRTVDEVVPVIAKAAVSVDTVNSQLGKVDIMLDSAVDMTESLDTTVRAVSFAITEPVKKVSGVVAGAGEAVTSFRDRMRTEGADGVPDATDSVGSDDVDSASFEAYDPYEPYDPYADESSSTTGHAGLSDDAEHFDVRPEDRFGPPGEPADLDPEAGA